METLSQATARRIAIAAQGLERRGMCKACCGEHLDAVLARIHLLQIDSVSVLTRAHYLPLFSRLGPYDRGLLDAASWGKRRRWFEYWGHEASLMPFALHALLRWRMADAADGKGLWPGLRAFQAEQRPYIEAVLQRIASGGAVQAADIEGEKGKSGWWGWGQAKRALEVLFWRGEISVAARRGFERVYDLTERVLPEAVLSEATPPKREAQKALLRLAAQAHGIGSAVCLADYFRISPIAARPLLAELVEEGTLLPVMVEGIRGVWFLHREAKVPARVRGQALLAPFDPLIWERERSEKLFGFRYRLEIYTPAEKRVHGYYVLPFLLGDRLVARVDVKADRAAGALMVPAAFQEEGAPRDTAEVLREELGRMAEWLGLERVTISDRGDLARMLKKDKS